MKTELPAAVLLLACLPVAACAQVNLDDIRLPPGFGIEVYADGVENARQMALGANGTLFVGSRRAGLVHAVVDTDGDQAGDRVLVIDEDLNMPSGTAFRDGSLYVAAVDRILRYDDIENRLEDPPEPVVLTDEFPDEEHHGWKYLRFGPDGFLYVPVGAPCNICLERDFATIRRLNVADGSQEIFARGVRNSVGLAFHPDTGDLWFTDNGRDMMGDNLPSCELNRAPRAGMHFGFPYCHQGNVPDPEFGRGKDCADFIAPEIKLGPHVAPLGLVFYTGSMFPDEYRGQLFVAEHGSWNRSNKIGYRLKLVHFSETGVASGQRIFADGWLQGEENWGRPNDVLVMPDGALLVSDDQAGAIYRISYRPSL